MRNACAISYCHLCPACLHHICPHYLTNSSIFGNKFLNIKRALCPSLRHLSKIFLVVCDLQTSSLGATSPLCKEYTGCPRRNVPDFGRVFLMLKYTDVTQNTYIQSWTRTKIMATEKCGFLAVPGTVPVQLTRFPYIAHVLESGMQSTLWLLDIHVPCKVLGTLRTSTALVRVFM
jgi:hypothetical protein